MRTEMLTTRIDHDTKLAFTNVCEEMGLSTSQAIKLFAKAVINYGGIPFELKAKTPNALTVAAIEELEASIAYAIDRSPLRRDGETIKYVLERVWNKYLYLAMPDIGFKDDTTNT